MDKEKRGGGPGVVSKLTDYYTEMGRNTRKTITNVLIVVAIVGLIYWDSTRRKADDEDLAKLRYETERLRHSLSHIPDGEFDSDAGAERGHGAQERDTSEFGLEGNPHQPHPGKDTDKPGLDWIETRHQEKDTHHKSAKLAVHPKPPPPPPARHQAPHGGHSASAGHHGHQQEPVTTEKPRHAAPHSSFAKENELSSRRKSEQNTHAPPHHGKVSAHEQHKPAASHHAPSHHGNAAPSAQHAPNIHDRLDVSKEKGVPDLMTAVHGNKPPVVLPMDDGGPSAYGGGSHHGGGGGGGGGGGEATTMGPHDHTPGEHEELGLFSFVKEYGKEAGHHPGVPSVPKTGDRPKSSWGKFTDKPTPYSYTVSRDDLDHFRAKLPPLLKNYKNPCWIEEIPEPVSYEDSYYRKCIISRKRDISKHAYKYDAFEHYILNRTKHGENWRIRCYPHFFLLGVGKCGTTDFFDTMKNYVTDFVPGFLKELHFWEWKRCYHRPLCRSIRPRHPEFTDYLDAYDAAAEVIRRTPRIDERGETHHPLVVGDFTPSTLTFSPCWSYLPGNEGLDEPRYTTAHYVRSMSPQAKFIIMLRDPVERVYSNYRMNIRLSKKNVRKVPEKFHEDMVKTIADMNNCFRQKTARACAYQHMNFDMETHVTNSMYAIFVDEWLSLFPRDQFLVLRLEDYNQSRVETMRRSLRFLGISPLTAEQEYHIARKPITNLGPSHDDMYPHTRQLLQDFYRPWNRRLAQLLNDERYTWGY